MPSFVRTLFVPVLLLGWPLALWATPPQIGSALPELNLQDQHGRDWRVTAHTRLLIVATGRAASNLVQEVLTGQPGDVLAARQALYLADLSRMPGFITRTFALPALREQPFAVGVVLQPQTLADWPRADEAVTLISLQDGRVTAIEQARDAATLRAALGLQPAEAAR